MGRGDSRTKRGKIFKASYGNVRKHRVATSSPKSASKPATSTTLKKTPVAKKTK
jgi:ribosomal small subunit protein bTHX